VSWREIWRVDAGEIVEDWPYERDRFEFHEPDLDETLTACGMWVKTLREPSMTFYSPAVLDALDVEWPAQ